MTEPPAEETITIVDDAGREKIQQVAYTVVDVRGEKVYVTDQETVQAVRFVTGERHA